MKKPIWIPSEESVGIKGQLILWCYHPPKDVETLRLNLVDRLLDQMKVSHSGDLVALEEARLLHLYQGVGSPHKAAMQLALSEPVSSLLWDAVGTSDPNPSEFLLEEIESQTLGQWAITVAEISLA